jgi:hypothetical protein
MSIEKQIERYNTYARERGTQDYKHFLSTMRKAQWVHRCAERKGIRLAVTIAEGYMHAGTIYLIPQYAIKRRAINLDEGVQR